jgi:hypothetical protein
MSCAITVVSMAHLWRKRFAPLLLVRLSKNQWRIGVRHLGFSNGAPMAHGAPSARADGTSPTDQRNQDHGARAAPDIAGTVP